MQQAKQLDRTETEPTVGIGSWLSTTLGRLLVSLFVPVVTFVILWRVFLFLRDADIPQSLGLGSER